MGVMMTTERWKVEEEVVRWRRAAAMSSGREWQ
jgi:hypothetical protein